MQSPIHPVTGYVTTLGIQRLRGLFGGTAIASGMTAYASTLLAFLPGLNMPAAVMPVIAGVAFVAATLGFLLSGFGSKIRKLITLDERGINLGGKRHVPYAHVRGILPSESFHTLRITTTDETLILSFHGEDPRRVAEVARAIHARMTKGLWEIESTRPSVLGGTLALFAAGCFALGAASGPLPMFLFPLGLAFAALASYFFAAGSVERLRIGEDGVELTRGRQARGRLSMRDGLTVAAEARQIVFSTGARSLSLRLPGDMASTLAAQLADATARQRDPDAQVQVPPLERGQARAWLDRVRALQGDRYRGRVETEEDLRAIVLDGTRSAAERVYAALRIRALGEQSQLVQLARDTTVSPRLRISLDAALTGDDTTLAAELEALAEEDHSAPERQRFTR